ncbi:carboxypeptidase A4 [Aplysia californica]|uniref:Carboxypeptidase A4 n=1 Tax=Aplysia californica TaxID=6500 RepID=A0ABM1AF08_APLCA|nr:carboxypeptidase A4 [Aplysia californica]
MMSATFSLVLSLVALCTAQQATFEGYELLSFDVKDAREANHLRELGEQYPELDFWLEPVPGRRSNVLVPPPLLSEVKSRLVVRGLPYQVAADDVQAIVDAGTARTPVDEAERKRATGGYIIDHTNYHNYTQITGDGNTSDRPAIVIEAGIHAREWISPAANLYFLEKTKIK